MDSQTLEKEIFALKKEVARVKAQKRNLVEHLHGLAIRNDFPCGSVQDYLNESYQHRHGHPVLNSIAFDIYPNESFEKLAKTLADINPEFGDRIEAYGIDFWVIAHNQTYSQSGYVETNDFGIDTEGWGLFQSELEQDDETSERIRDAISQFRSDLYSEIKQYLEEDGITECIDEYVAKRDVLATVLTIKEVSDQKAYVRRVYVSSHQELIAPDENESEWEFINSNRGQLIGRSQILNPEMLPKGFRSHRIFAVY
jgi:hypothetical protein